METSALSVVNSWHGTGSTKSWTDGGNIQCGTPSQGGNYRSKIAISTAGLVIHESSRLVVSIKVSNESYPAHCSGILTELDIADPGDVQNSNATAPSADLSAAAIATSVAFNQDGSAFPSKWVDTGSTFYFVFDTEQLQADKTYYVYVIRTATSNTWVKGKESNVEATLTYTSYTACSAPTVFSGPEAFNNTITLSWSGAQAGGNNPIAGYTVECKYSTDNTTWSDWFETWSQENPSGVTLTADWLRNDGIDIKRGNYFIFRIQTRGTAGADYYSDWMESNLVQRLNPVGYIRNGNAHIPHAAYIHNGTEYVRHIPYKHNGTEWEICS